MDTILGSLVPSCCGEGGTLQTNNTGVCSQCLSHTGPAPAHGACALPAHTAQALSHSADNSLRLALGCMYFPGLSHSVSVIGYFSKVQTALGLCFVPFPGLSSSGDEVFGECSRSDLSPPPSLQLDFLGVALRQLLR